MEKTTIYYFTGTGNSLNVARKISEGLKGSELKSIAHIMKQSNGSKGNITSSSKKNWNCISSCCLGGAPLIVEAFVKKNSISKAISIYSQ